MNPEIALSSLAALAIVAFAACALWAGLRRPRDLRPIESAPHGEVLRVLLRPNTVTAGWRGLRGGWTVVRKISGIPMTAAAEDDEVRGWFPLW